MVEYKGITFDEFRILIITKEITSQYRKKYFRDNGFTMEQADEVRQSLISKGLLNKNTAISAKGKKLVKEIKDENNFPIQMASAYNFRKAETKKPWETGGSREGGWRFKTEQEFFDEYGEDWLMKVDWAHPEMNWLFGTRVDDDIAQAVIGLKPGNYIKVDFKGGEENWNVYPEAITNEPLPGTTTKKPTTTQPTTGNAQADLISEFIRLNGEEITAIREESEPMYLAINGVLNALQEKYGVGTPTTPITAKKKPKTTPKKKITPKERVAELILALNEATSSGERADLWNEGTDERADRNVIYPGTGNTLWQIAIAENLPVGQSGKESYIDFDGDQLLLAIQNFVSRMVNKQVKQIKSKTKAKSERKAPSTKANDVAEGTIMTGNDGNEWISERRGAAKSQRWFRYNPATAKTKKPKSSGFKATPPEKMKLMAELKDIKEALKYVTKDDDEYKELMKEAVRLKAEIDKLN